MRRVGLGGSFDQLPKATKTLIITCGLVYLAQRFVPILVPLFGLTPVVAFSKYWVWQFVTYSFLHANFWHLFWNMFSLWMFGASVENYWGAPTFLKYYFICVAGAGVFQALLAPDFLVIGASGGIYGLLLAFAFLFPDAIISLFLVFPMRALQAVIAISFITLLLAVDSGGSRVAHMAHLGGLVVGFLYFKIPVWRLKLRGFRPHVILPEPQQQMAAKVDEILEKISQYGVDSLTESERELMKRYSEKKGE